MNVRTLVRSLCACIVVGLLAEPVSAELPRYGASQKSAEQKGYPAPPHHKHKEHPWWCPPPPPMAPILEAAAVLRVAGPVRNTRIRFEQNVDTNPEAGEETPEAGVEHDADILALTESVKSLDKRVDDLYLSLKLLVEQLGK